MNDSDFSTLAQVRRLLALADRASTFTSDVSCRAANKLDEIARLIKHLDPNVVGENMHAALIAEIGEIKEKAWAAFSACPDGRIRQMRELLGDTPTKK